MNSLLPARLNHPLGWMPAKTIPRPKLKGFNTYIKELNQWREIKSSNALGEINIWWVNRSQSYPPLKWSMSRQNETNKEKTDRYYVQHGLTTPTVISKKTLLRKCSQYFYINSNRTLNYHMNYMCSTCRDQVMAIGRNQLPSNESQCVVHHYTKAWDLSQSSTFLNWTMSWLQ